MAALISVTLVKEVSPREFFWSMKPFSITILNLCIAFSIHRLSRGGFVFGDRGKLSWFLSYGGQITYLKSAILAIFQTFSNEGRCKNLNW